MSELVIHLCVPRNLHSELLLTLCLVITTLDNLSKRSFSKDLDYLIPIGNMLSYFNAIVPFDVVENGVSLEFSVAKVFFGFVFLLVECLDAVVFSILETLEVLSCSMGDGSCKVNCLELVFTSTQLLNFLIKHSVFIKINKRLPVQRLIKRTIFR